ncbi:type I-E CRISPR-associated protein Cse1/CasA [Rhizobium daejeonense]|uniref:Type I-E CRISPR-associated protein Cse1/CasA n=1 Tax=Rhizobium daejeonense TaxID=240521 RepID=A0A6M1S0U5_9HYPH|nr:type I-E CRISPR-associated protein Cse1/CasA [Rhizobium daejeonense]NGO62710.1 type I-E CRISPR-associated protein Cse1/CasA [Rhizobium daejeonense]
MSGISAFNLVADPFFPVVTLGGGRRWATLAGLRQEEGDYPVAFDWPRPDLNVAALEFAIGVLALVFQPEDGTEWADIWKGKSDIDLDRRLEALSFAFNLVGDEKGAGPRFLQEYVPIDGDANPVEALFIDTPGVNGQKKNADLLTQRRRFPALGLKAAAIALHALQQFAPSGGAGNRTSLRGGGPMTTLVWPERGDGGAPAPLWRVLLANLPTSGRAPFLPDAELARALPWLAPTFTSDGKTPVELSEADPRVHPLQAFFGMPRRIRLVMDGEGRCPVTGEEGPLVTGFIQKPWGTNYGVWRHPLTPYRQTKEADPPFSVKPKSTRFSYRDWVGAAIRYKEKGFTSMPALPVELLGDRGRYYRQAGFDASRLLAAGWAMNNMEAGAYLLSVQPLHLAETEERTQVVGTLARMFADAGDATASLLRSNLKLALFGDGAKTSTDSGVFEEATDAFFEETEDAFHDALDDFLEHDFPVDLAFRKRWLSTLRRTALAIFDRHATELLAETADAKLAERITIAYRRLRGALSEAGKIATGLLIEPPVDAPKPKGRTKKGTAA